jgi:hypothetical protein
LKKTPFPEYETIAQNAEDGQDSETAPPVRAVLVSLDQAEPWKVTTWPSLSAPAQNCFVGHDMLTR